MKVKKIIARDGLIILGVVILGGIIASQYSDDRFILLKQYFAVISAITPSLRSPLYMGLGLPVVFIVWAIETLRKK